LLLTCEPGALERLASGLAAATGTRLTAVGEMTDAADGIRYLDAVGRAVSVRTGFEHFVTGRARGWASGPPVLRAGRPDRLLRDPHRRRGRVLLPRPGASPARRRHRGD